MKKLIANAVMVVLGVCLAWGQSVQTNYDMQMSNIKVYRIALGSGQAPTASDMAYIGVRPGDMVINVSDDSLYIMSSSNAYTKVTSAGVLIPKSTSFYSLELGNGTILTNPSVGEVDIRYNNLNSTNLLTMILKSYTTSTNVADGDRMWLRFQAPNDSSETITYGSVEIVASDSTTNTEDGSFRLYIPVNGVEDTKVLTLDVTGATIVGDVIASDDALMQGGDISLTNTGAASTVRVTGAETNIASIELEADDGDDANDTLTIKMGLDDYARILIGALETLRINDDGTIVASNSMTASGFIGSGQLLTGLNAANATGVLGAVAGTPIVNAGTLTGAYAAGSGQLLTGLNAANATGVLGAVAGTPYVNGGTITGVVGAVAGSPIVNAGTLTGAYAAGSGQLLTDLNAANATGVLGAVAGTPYVNAGTLTGAYAAGSGQLLTGLNAANATGVLGAVAGTPYVNAGTLTGAYAAGSGQLLTGLNAANATGALNAVASINMATLTGAVSTVGALTNLLTGIGYTATVVRVPVGSQFIIHSWTQTGP